jgi:hypothetical protein
MEGIRVITKLPNSEQSYKGKVKTHKYIKPIDSSEGIYLRTLHVIPVRFIFVYLFFFSNIKLLASKFDVYNWKIEVCFT